MHAIRRTVLAEGVETAEQAQALIEMGIDYIQGFYYARPMPEDEFIRFVAEKNGRLSA
jgi:EAL domain-containing protein (putative c-di-GMP-specific phosphodiesterase class I)